jgi:hypothetical protein
VGDRTRRRGNALEHLRERHTPSCNAQIRKSPNLSYRFARVYRETAQIAIRVNGVPADRFRLLVYREFLGVFLSEIVPRFLAGEAERGEASFYAALGMLLHRTWIFYGFWTLPFLAGGIILWSTNRRAFRSRFLTAWALTYVLLIVLRTAAPDLFDKVKEMLWVAPLVSLAAAETLAWLQRSFPVKWPAVAGYGVLAAYGISFYARAIASTFALAR